MRGRGRHGRGQDTLDMRTRMQQAGVASAAAGDTRADGMGDRSVPHLQGCPRAQLGGGGQCVRLAALVGHVRGSREGPPFCVRPLRRRAVML